jgi:Phage gp6-like head-tail connector protein
MLDRYNRRSVAFVAQTDDATDIIPLADAKEFLRIHGNDDDLLLIMLIGAAVDAAEKYTRRAIRRATYELTLDGFPYFDDDNLARLGAGTFDVARSYVLGTGDEFDLPYPPVNSITSITTYNRANAAAVVSPATYLLDGGRIVLNDGYTWPTDLRDRAAVKVAYAAGYGPVNVPVSIKIGMMQHLVAMYDCRTGCDMPEAARGLMNGYRILDGLTW